MRDVYVLDTRDSSLAGYFRQAAQARPGEKRIIEVNRAWSMNQIVNRVKENSDPGQLRTLRLCAHGNSGYMELGREGLTVDSVSHFQILANYERFHRAWGKIEIHACAFASGTDITCRRYDAFENPTLSTDRVVVYSRGCAEESPGTISQTAPGLPIMQEMANRAGVKVVAAINAQRPDETFSFEGPVIVRHPQVVAAP